MFIVYKKAAHSIWVLMTQKSSGIDEISSEREEEGAKVKKAGKHALTRHQSNKSFCS